MISLFNLLISLNPMLYFMRMFYYLHCHTTRHLTRLFILFFRIIYLIGEADKWIPHSRQRIHGMTLTSTDVKVTLSGAVSEVVHYTIYDTDRGDYVSFTCTVGQNGQTVLSVDKGKCEN